MNVGTGTAPTALVMRSKAPILTVVVGAILRHRLPLVAVWFAYCCWSAVSVGNDWIWFSWGSDLLFGQHHPAPLFHTSAQAAGGLHVYANYIFLQMGPLSLLPAQVLRHLGPFDGLYAATAFIGLLGFGAYAALDRIAVRARPGKTSSAKATSLVAGLALAPCWGQVAGGYSHLDDAMALSLAVAAYVALRRDRSVLAGALLGAAVASKTWAIPFLALCFVPAGYRRKLVSFAIAWAVTAVAWLPFLIADPHTTRLGDLGLIESLGSTLRVFGISHITHPGALRMSQFVLGFALALLMVRRGHPEAVLLVGMASRLMLEPMTFTYYTGGLVFAAVAFDLLVWRRPLPIMTAITWLYMLALSNYVTDPYDRAWLRLAATAGAVLVALGVALRANARPQVAAVRDVEPRAVGAAA